jgi:hypothetical protein
MILGIGKRAVGLSGGVASVGGLIVGLIGLKRLYGKR